MRAADEEARAASSCGVAAASPAPGPGANDALPSPPVDGAPRVSNKSQKAEKSTRTLDEAVETLEATADTDAVDETSPTTQETGGTTGKSEHESVCSACGQAEGSSGRGLVLVCADCGTAVHRNCYGHPRLNGPRAATLDGNTTTERAWRCDCCTHGVSTSAVACVYCCQAGDGVMRAVDTSNAVWRSLLPPKQGASVPDVQNTAPHLGHLLCIAWDPWSLASRSGETTETKPADPKQQPTTTSDAAPSANDAAPVTTPVQRPLLDPRSLLAPGACCLCGSSAGVRIQCRRRHCGRFFHAMCASKDSRGYLERVDAGAMSQFHAYCDRHCACREDVVTFLEKLVSKPVTSLIGRDDSRRFHTMLKRASTYTSIETLLADIASLLVGFCHKGLRGSRSDPPTYLIKHLQVLQLFLDHVPQLEITYALQPVAAKTRVGDAKLYQHLVKTFNPPRYLSRFPGPLSQQHTCAVCFEPFLERQHLFYCTNATEPHEQHWQCTKRASMSRDRDRHAPNGSTSKKKKQSATATVSNDVWIDVKLPNALLSVAGGVVCGVCASPVDLRGLIASDKDAKRSEFEKKPSVFAYHGCFVNAGDQKTSGRSSRGSSPARIIVAPSSRPSAKSSATGGRASDSRSSRRLPATTTVVDSAKASSVVHDEPAGPVELAPLKMERINVQRTARWLACVGQIIRLAGRAREAANAPVDENETVPTSDEAMPAASSPEASPDLPSDPSQQQLADEPMPAAADAEEAPDRAEPSADKAIARSENNQDGTAPPISSTLTVSVDEVSSPKEDAEMESVETTQQATTKPKTTAVPTNSTLDDATTLDGLVSNGTPEARHYGPATGDEAMPEAASHAVQPVNGSAGETANVPTGVPSVTRTAIEEADGTARRSLISLEMQAYFDEAIRVVSPFDPYALDRIETAREMLARRSGPGVAVLRMLAQEYTRFVHTKHLRAAEKVRNEKRKREELEAQQRREREKRRVDREAELALKKKMLAMRKKQRTHIHEQA